MTSKSLAAALAAAAIVGTPATAQAAPTLLEKYESRYERVQKIGLEPGRHIVEDGVGSNGRQASNERIAKSARLMLSWLRAARAPEPPASPGPAPSTQAASSSYSAPPTTPTPSSSGGSCGPGYRGLYQFDCQTWSSVGCSGDPAAASPEYQRSCAEKLQSQRGNAPWPVCGQGGASLEQIARCESGGDPGAVG